MLDENWAIFVEENSIKWSYGVSDVEKFQEQVFSFFIGLGKLGNDLFGEGGIANITFDLEKHSGFKAGEIFIVSLYDKFFFIISDPILTLRLIMTEAEIPNDIKEIMNAVLVGQASILYGAGIDTENVTLEEKEQAIQLFRDIILDLNQEYGTDGSINTIAGRSGCNFSALTFEECLLLHVYLRKQADIQSYYAPSSWCLISHLDGGDIPFSYNMQDEVLFGGYFSAIISLIEVLFKSKPKNITFGSIRIRRLRFIYGETYFMAIDRAFMIDLLLKRHFQQQFFDARYEVMKDLAAGIKELIIEEILQYNEDQLNQLSGEILLDTYFKQGSENLELFVDKDLENLNLLREEHKNQVLRVWGRYLSNL
ncbi:MAG: hypothetical protein ACFFE8_10815 [Candidatus Heimdallarchaeota archaeon]